MPKSASKFNWLFILFVSLILVASQILAVADDLIKHPFRLDPYGLGMDKMNLSPILTTPVITPITKPAAAQAITLHQLYIAAPPTKNQVLDRLREKAAEELHWLYYYKWVVFFEGLNAVLSFQGGSPAAEIAYREAREHFAKYIDIHRQIDEINGVKEAQENYRKRLQNMIINRNPHYDVQIENTTIRNYPAEPEPDSPKQKNEPRNKWKEVTELKIEKVLKDVGFDKEGKPYREWRYDVVRRKRRVPN